MPATTSPSVKSIMLAMVRPVPGMNWVMPGKPRTVACMTMSTMIPARSRMSEALWVGNCPSCLTALTSRTLFHRLWRLVRNYTWRNYYKVNSCYTIQLGVVPLVAREERSKRYGGVEGLPLRQFEREVQEGGHERLWLWPRLD